MFLCFFFFFKQKTAYEIGTGDWSSDVCSSDLTSLFLELCLEKCAELGTFLQTSPFITHNNAYKKYMVSLTWVIFGDKYGIFKF